MALELIMSRTLSRPMFRRGGSAGEGITSGLRPRQGYADKGWVQQVLPTEEEIASITKLRGPRPRSTNLNDFLINFGLDIASRPPQGGLLSTAAASAKEPFAQFQQRKMYEQETPRKERGDIIGQIIAGKAEALAGESAGQIYSQEKLGILGQEALSRKQSHILKWQDIWSDPTTLTEEQKKERQDWINERDSIQMDLDRFKKTSGVDIEEIIAAEGGIDNLKQSNKKELLKGPLSEEMMTHPITGEQITVGEYYETNPHLIEKKIIEMTEEDINEIVLRHQNWPGAKGGRAGYRAGELVEQEDVNIQTPRGDVSMQETVVEDMPSDQLSYEELRSRLPVEITDDIVRLLVSSAAALGDFATIQTQQDVDNFNAKYGVNLVLPSEA
jgi:hypothetical protein